MGRRMPEPLRITVLPPYVVGSSKMTEIFVKFLSDHTPLVWRETGRYEKPTHTLEGRHIVVVGAPQAPEMTKYEHPWQWQNRVASWIVSMDNTELLLHRQIYFERWTWRTGTKSDWYVFRELDRAFERRQRPEFPQHLKITWVQ